MKELIEFIAKALVDNPDAIYDNDCSGAANFPGEGTDADELLAAAQEDMGRIIGKQGRTAKAMRTLLNAKATRENKRAVLQILE